jgi:CRISPR/Cas system-associated protein endoribonuclease Cas2
MIILCLNEIIKLLGFNFRDNISININLRAKEKTKFKQFLIKNHNSLLELSVYFIHVFRHE